MSRFAKVFFSILAIAAIFGLVLRAQDIIRQDPLSRLGVPISSIGIQLQGVSVRHFSRAKLTGVSYVKTIDVRQDHQYLDFFGIEKGKFETPKGEVLFTADEGNYNAITRQLNVYGGGHVKAKNFDARTSAFLYDQNSSTLSMPGAVKGTFVGGKLMAIGLTYHGSTGGYSIKHMYWDGPGDKISEGGLGQQEDNQRTRWHISGGLEVANGIDHYTDMRADDGEILVKAPKGERDEKTDVLTVTGPVYYFSEKANLVCDKAVIYRKEKRAVLTGNVHMLVKPKDQEKLEVTEIPPWSPPVPAAVAASRPAAPPATPESQQQKDLDNDLRSAKTIRKYPAHIKADEIEYWYGKGNRHANITGSPQCYQEFPDGRWRRVVTHEAFYDGEKDELTLKSATGQRDTRMLDSIGDDLVATQFIVSTKEDEADDYSGKDVEGVYAANDEDIPVKNGGNGQSDSGNTPAVAPGGAPASPTSTPSGPIPAKPNPNTPTPNNPTPTNPAPTPASPPIKPGGG